MMPDGRAGAEKVLQKSMENESMKNLQIEIDNLIREAYELLPEIIKSTRPSDIRSKSQNARWWNRHRLHVLLDAAIETRDKLSNNIAVAPWFLVEFKTTVEIIKRWKDNPQWKGIEPSLVDKNNFTHTIGKLQIAEHIMKSGHEVEIVPRNKEASPDLRIKAIGGTQDWIYVECYQPNSLTGEPKHIPDKILNKIIDKSMKKAKRQFKKKYPGIMAVFSYNQSNINFERLKQKITNRLHKTDRPYLAGILMLNQSVLFKNMNNNASFTQILSVNFILNPSYFGRIDVISETPDDDSTLLIEPFESIKTEELLRKKISDTSRIKINKLSPQKIFPKIKELRLSIIEVPKPLSKVIIQSQNGEVYPFFQGHGNINYLCGNCNTVLAKHIWNLSISNIVILCPSCQFFNEFPKIEEIKYSIKGTIALEKGTYNFSKWVDVKQGVILFGI